MSETEKEPNSYRFNFMLDTDQTLSEEKQKEISEYLKRWLTQKLLNIGFHPSGYRLDNEWYLQEKVLIPFTEEEE